MGKVLYNDNCLGVLKDALSDKATSVYLTGTENFPSISESSTDYYYLTLVNDVTNSTEIIRVYRSSPTTGLIMFHRAHGGTTAKAFPIGTRAELRMNKVFFDSYDQLGRALPLFSYRMESASNLPEGWYACDGKEYLKSSVPGRFLTTLSPTVKNNWNLKETTTAITIPNMYVDNVGAMITPGIPGMINRMNIYAKSQASTTNTDLFFIPTINMTPALFFGV